MRAVLSLSLPAEKKRYIERQAKKYKKTVSAYVLDTFDMAEDMITEEDLLKRSKEALKNYKNGKVKKLNSLKDLMN